MIGHFDDAPGLVCLIDGAQTDEYLRATRAVLERVIEQVAERALQSAAISFDRQHRLLRQNADLVRVGVICARDRLADEGHQIDSLALQDSRVALLVPNQVAQLVDV